MKLGQITNDFYYSEFEKSETAERYGFINAITTQEVRDHVKELTEQLLQPLRDAWGKPLIITSGYRCRRLNEIIGGAATSAHTTGYAADVVPQDGRTDEFFGFVKSWLTYTGRAFDQVAIEHNRQGSRWVHIGLKGPNNRQLRKFYEWTKS